MKWEYKQVILTHEVQLERLIASKENRDAKFAIPELINQCGEEEWELVTIIVTHVGTEECLIAYFKRPK